MATWNDLRIEWNDGAALWDDTAGAVDPGLPVANTDLAAAIAAAAAMPKRAPGDNGSATQHDLADLILADQYLAAKNRRGPGFKMYKIVPGGAR